MTLNSPCAKYLVVFLDEPPLQNESKPIQIYAKVQGLFQFTAVEDMLVIILTSKRTFCD